jgi:RNA polymerase sigma-70 factor, ECF subfamily
VRHHDFSITEAQVRAAQAGDRSSLDELFRRYAPRVARIVACRLGRDWRELAECEDIVQETFVDALAAIRGQQLDNEGAFCSWLARCVQNNIRDALRAGQADKRGGGEAPRLSELNESYLTDSLFTGNEPTPSEHAGARETEDALERALSTLDERYREVICLRAYCDMPYREIAEAMGLRTENMANVLFLRAREELRRKLGGEL